MLDNPASLISSIYEAFGRGDVDTVLAAFDREIVWHTPAALPWSAGRYQYPAGVADYFRAFLAAIEEPAIEPEDFIVDGGRVVALGVERGRARTTGRAFAARFAHVWTVDNGRVQRFEGVVDTDAITRAFSQP